MVLFIICRGCVAFQGVCNMSMSCLLGFWLLLGVFVCIGIRIGI